MSAEPVLKPGDVLVASWGYEQTNIDYYLVTKRTAKSVKLQPIGKKNVALTGHMTGTCEPDPDSFLDAPEITRRVRAHSGSEWVTVNDYTSATLWSGQPNSWSSYA